MSTRISLFLSALIIGAVGAFMAIVYPQLSLRVPMHWNLQGQADSWMPKAQAVWALGGLLIGIFGLFALLPILSPKKFKLDSFEPTYNILRVLMVGLVGYIVVVSLFAAMGSGFDSGRAVIGGLMLFVAVLGNYLGKVKRNFWIGVRVPWTLANEKNWVATHRMAAWLLVAAGLIGAVATFAGTPLPLVLTILMIATISPVFYSLWLFKSGRDSDGNGAGVAVAILVALLCSSAQAAEREVSFKGAGDLELKGTLLVPDKAEAGKTKALLLIPGSGPTDRNGNQAPAFVTDLLKQVADRLASEGIATLRYDKRASPGYATSFPKDLPGLNDFFSFENFVTDAESALAFLRRQPEIDPAHAGVFGHSEGATIALMMSQGKNPPSALILAAGAGRPVGEVLYDQVEFGLATRSDDRTESAKVLNDLKQAMATFKTTKQIPSSLAPGLQMFFPAYLPRYLYTFYFWDPVPAAKAFPGSVLILQGAKDVQISPIKDMPKLKEALASRADAKLEVVLVEKASHNFKEVADEKKEPGIAGPVIPAALDAVAKWARERL